MKFKIKRLEEVPIINESVYEVEADSKEEAIVYLRSNPSKFYDDDKCTRVSYDNGRTWETFYG